MFKTYLKKDVMSQLISLNTQYLIAIIFRTSSNHLSWLMKIESALQIVKCQYKQKYVGTIEFDLFFTML